FHDEPPDSGNFLDGRFLLKAGALCTYGPDLAVSYRRLAYYVDSILKGAKAAELPIERPTKFQLVLNLRSARRLGLTVPETSLSALTRSSNSEGESRRPLSTQLGRSLVPPWRSASDRMLSSGRR